MFSQQFIVTIPILSDKVLKKVPYIYEGHPERPPIESYFPGIPMLRHNIDPSAEISIVVIYTCAGNYQNNLELFYTELQSLSDEIGVDLRSKVKEISVPYEETRDKHVSFFVELGNAFIENADLYMDLTYGSKVSPITEFALLPYAEYGKMCRCKEVIYGKVIGSDTPTIYDIKELYQMSRLINTISRIPGSDLNKLLNTFQIKENN